MTVARHLLGRLGSAALLLSACSDPVLGENDCYGEKTRCQSDAPSHDVASDWASLRAMQGATGDFEVTASRTLTPTWRRDWPCAPELCFAASLALAPDGDVWLAQARSELGELRRIDVDGELVARHAWTPAAAIGPLQLLVDADYAPTLVHTSVFDVLQILRFDAGSVLASAAALPRTHGSPTLALSGAEGALYFLEYDGERLSAEAFDQAGALAWRQIELRAYVERGPLPEVNSGAGVAPLRDGGFAFWTDKLALQPPGGVSSAGPSSGITAVDADGNLRWDAYVAELGGAYLLAEDRAGALVATFANGAGDLGVVSIGPDGALQRGWVGRRVDFYAVTPLRMAVDPAGDIYLALLTGQRSAAALSICKLTGADVHRDVVCVEVEGLFDVGREWLARADVSDTGDVSGFGSLLQVVAPAPDVLLFLESARIDGTSDLVTRMLRVDFPATP